VDPCSLPRVLYLFIIGSTLSCIHTCDPYVSSPHTWCFRTCICSSRPEQQGSQFRRTATKPGRTVRLSKDRPPLPKNCPRIPKDRPPLPKNCPRLSENRPGFRRTVPASERPSPLPKDRPLSQLHSSKTSFRTSARYFVLSRHSLRRLPSPPTSTRMDWVDICWL
jgi:hypothetical protein